jgi:hypothetical protein
MKPYLKKITPDGSETVSAFQIIDDTNSALMTDDTLGLRIREEGGGCWLQLDHDYPEGLTVHAQSLPAIWGIEETTVAQLASELRRCGRKLEFHFGWGDFITDEINREFYFFCGSKAQADAIQLEEDDHDHFVKSHLKRWGLYKKKPKASTSSDAPKKPQPSGLMDEEMEEEMEEFLRNRDTLQPEFLRREADKLFKQCGLDAFDLEHRLDIIFCGLMINDDHHLQLIIPPMNVHYPKATEEHVDEILNQILERLPEQSELEFFIDEGKFMDDEDNVDTSGIEMVLYSMVSDGIQDQGNPDLFRFDRIEARNEALRRIATALLALAIYNLSLLSEEINQAVDTARADQESEEFNEDETYWMLWQENYECALPVFHWMR